MNARISCGAVALAAVIGLTACGAPDAPNTTTPGPTAETNAPTTPPADGGQGGGDDGQSGTGQSDGQSASEGDAGDNGAFESVTRAAIAALDLAEAETGGIAYELSDDDDETQWQIDINDGGTDIEVHVDWAGATVVRSEPDGSVDTDTLEKLGGATLTIQQAITAATTHATGQLDEAELDTENGVVVWQVSFDDGPRDTTVVLDARTGDLVKLD